MSEPELGLLLKRLLDEVIRREVEILEPRGIGMWDYVVLSALARGAVHTQAALAQATGRDKTRLIVNLDRLEDAGLLTRDVDPADRRNRIVTLTARGRQVREEVHRAITVMERDLLEPLGATDRSRLRTALITLVGDSA